METVTRITCALAVLCLWGGVAGAQVQGRIGANRTPGNPGNGPTTDNTPTLKPGSVEGVVTNSVNGEAVKKASVTLRNMGQGFAYAGVTDVAGHFLIENVQPGNYQAMATRDGFMPDVMRRSANSIKAIVVAEEQHVKDIAVKLMPLGLINGKVLDEAGEPIAGANVQPLRYNYFSGKKQLSPWGNASTNDLGEFQLLDLQPGRYYIQVTPNQRQQFQVSGRVRGASTNETYPSTFYPSGLDVGQATPIEVSAGSQLSNIDLRLRKTRSYTVRGKVVDVDGSAARNAAVQLMPQGGAGFMGFNRMFSGVMPDGTFEIRGVTPGSYTAFSQRQEAGVNVSAQLAINVSDQDQEGLLLTLAPGFDISGTVRVEGTPAADPQATTQQQQAQQQMAQQRPVQISLQPTQQPGQNAQATVDADGSFVMHNVMPGLYQINAPGGPGKYLKSIRFGERDVPTAEIDLTQLRTGTISLVFGTDCGEISGTAQNKDGQAVQGIYITVAPVDELENRRDLSKQSATDQQGNFRVRDVAPGTYKVFAWEEFDQMVMQAPEVRKAFESHAATVNIGANGKESVQLKAISAADIEAEKSKLP